MGNQHSNSSNSVPFQCFQAQGRSNVNKSGNHTPHSDDFIMKHLQNNKINDASIAINCLDERRLVFVSLPGLYQSWQRVPSVLLYTSLLLLPLKQEWIYHPDKYVHELYEQIDPYTTADVFDTSGMQDLDFIHFLRWKDAQGLVLWILDELEHKQYSLYNMQTVTNALIAPFWHRLSAKLTSLYDHIEQRNYNPLIFDEKYWTNKDTRTFCSKYNTKMDCIISEFYFVTMKPNAMQEIIFQSNPKTLHPIVEYDYKSHLNITVYSTSSPTTPVHVHSDGMHTPSCEYDYDGITN